MKVGAGQIYLLASSALTLGTDGDVVQATIARGTAGFSATPADIVELLIPEGILRAANGQSAYGLASLLTARSVLRLPGNAASSLRDVGTHRRSKLSPLLAEI